MNTLIDQARKTTCFVTVVGNQGEVPFDMYLTVPTPNESNRTAVVDDLHRKIWYVKNPGRVHALVVSEVVRRAPDTWVIVLTGKMASEVWCYFVRWHF